MLNGCLKLYKIVKLPLKIYNVCIKSKADQSNNYSCTGHLCQE